MRHGFLISTALVAFLAAAPASFAFQIQHVPANSDGTPKFTDRGNLTGSTSENAAGNTGNALHFGSTTLTFGRSNGANSYGMSPALQDQLMLGPDPALRQR